MSKSPQCRQSWARAMPALKPAAISEAVSAAMMEKGLLGMFLVLFVQPGPGRPGVLANGPTIYARLAAPCNRRRGGAYEISDAAHALALLRRGVQVIESMTAGELAEELS